MHGLVSFTKSIEIKIHYFPPTNTDCTQSIKRKIVLLLLVFCLLFRRVNFNNTVPHGIHFNKFYLRIIGNFFSVSRASNFQPIQRIVLLLCVLL